MTSIRKPSSISPSQGRAGSEFIVERLPGSPYGIVFNAKDHNLVYFGEISDGKSATCHGEKYSEGGSVYWGQFIEYTPQGYGMSITAESDLYLRGKFVNGQPTGYVRGSNYRALRDAYAGSEASVDKQSELGLLHGRIFDCQCIF